MQTFLGTIAEDLYNRYKQQLADVCIVFPNRRSGLFFRKYLAELISEPIWSPEITTINDFFLQHAQWQTADQLTLLFELYNTWIGVTGYKESFDNFFYWGETLLRDFNDVDQYLAKAEDVFQTIEYQKNLDEQFQFLDEEQKLVLKQFWKNFENEELSSQQKEFIKVWEVLNKVYNEFKKSLANKNLAYEGMNYRDIIERVSKNEISFNYHKIIFIGFNALNKCEEYLFDYLQEKKLAEFYWDTNDYYLNNKYNEAGYYLRKNRDRYFESSKFPLSAFIEEKSENNLPKKIKIIGIPLEVGQAKVVGEVLQNTNYIAEQTAVVLADEHLLFPVLHSIPDNIKQMNVTMGYPFKDTQLHNFIESLIELQQTAKHKKNYSQFYHKSLIAVLKHSYFNSHNAKFSKTIIEQIEKQNNIYVTIEEQWQNDLFIQKTCKLLDKIEAVTAYLLEIVDYIYIVINKKNEGTNTIEQEYIYHFTLSLKRLNEIITQNKIDINLETFFRLLKKLIQQLRIPFAGEPLEGIQIMGLMETRCLDFENIFILSMNEGILPSKSIQISFIPYNIRKGYHLPVSDHQDAIFAYYFYRSIQRAKNIYLLYNTEAADDALSGEMSRFLYQLKYETGFGDVEFKILNRQIKSLPSQIISIPTNELIKNKLNKYVVNEKNEASILSPSAINTYLDCRLRFYFKYVACLYEKNEIKEDLDAADFGNLLHRAMELLYKPYENKIITKEIIDSLKNKIEEIVLLSLNEYYGNITTPLGGEDERGVDGKNIIIKNVIEEYIHAILKKDAAHLPFDIIGVELGSEEKLFYDFSCNINSETKKIRIGGKIDRIDKKENTVRIIDYKTGKDTKEIKDIASLFDPENKKRNKAAFQTILYGLLYQFKYAATSQIEPGLYNVKEMFSDDFTSKFSIDKNPLLNIDFISDEYQKQLRDILELIFNS